MANKLVVVLGATGTQGESVVSALLKHGAYAIRGIMRSPTAPAAKALESQVSRSSLPTWSTGPV